MLTNVFDFEKSFREVTIAQVNNTLCVSGILASRSLLIVNSKTGKAWNVIARIRQVDTRSMLKAMAKIMVAAAADVYAANHTENALKSKRNCERPFSKIAACDVIYATDKLGNVIPDSEFKVINELQHLTLKSIFKLNQKMPIYKYMQANDLDWTKPENSEALNVWIETILEQTNIVRKFHESFRKAAETNDPDSILKLPASKEVETAEVVEIIEDTKESGVA